MSTWPSNNDPYNNLLCLRDPGTLKLAVLWMKICGINDGPLITEWHLKLIFTIVFVLLFLQTCLSCKEKEVTYDGIIF